MRASRLGSADAAAAPAGSRCINGCPPPPHCHPHPPCPPWLTAREPELIVWQSESVLSSTPTSPQLNAATSVPFPRAAQAALQHAATARGEGAGSAAGVRLMNARARNTRRSRGDAPLVSRVTLRKLGPS